MRMTVTKAQHNIYRPITQEKFNALGDRINLQEDYTYAPKQQVGNTQDEITQIKLCKLLNDFANKP
jgi:hypothetical protein